MFNNNANSYNAPTIAPRTLVDFGAERVRRLADELRFAVPSGELVERFRTLVEPWGHRTLGAAPAWPSDITDDGTPIEFSLAFPSAGRPILRVLLEAQQPGAAGTLHDRWQAAWEQTAHLRSLYPRTDVARLERIRDLFEPSIGVDAEFAMWHAVDLSEPANAVVPKAYLNPMVLGEAAAAGLVREALARLGHLAAWADLVERLAERRNNRFVYLALDLEGSATARVKIYIAHDQVTYPELEAILAGSRGYREGDASSWCRSILDGEGPFTERPIISCFSFCEPGAPPIGTLHLPIRSYVRDDEVSAWRISRHLPPRITGEYRKALRTFAGRELRDGSSLQTYASFRRENEGVRLTVYLAPEAYAVSPASAVLESEVGPTPLRELGHHGTMAGLDAVIRARGATLREVPFCARLGGEGRKDHFRIVARGLTFFVMTFQDVLRKCASLVTDEQLREAAVRHRLEDMGHEAWFVHDLRRVCDEPGLLWLFGPEHEVTRDAAFSIMAELYRTSDDRVRVAVLLALEGAGHVFFKLVTAYLRGFDEAEELLYFARSHLDVEEAHEVFEEAGADQLAAVSVPPRVFEEACAAIDRIFGAIAGMAVALEGELRRFESTEVPAAATTLLRQARA